MNRNEVSEEKEVSLDERKAGPPLMDASDLTDINPLYQQCFAKPVCNITDLHLPALVIPKEERVDQDQMGHVSDENTREAEVAMSDLTINKHAQSIVDAVISVGKVECYTVI